MFLLWHRVFELCCTTAGKCGVLRPTYLFSSVAGMGKDVPHLARRDTFTNQKVWCAEEKSVLNGLGLHSVPAFWNS
jgi:hypothetical protein